MQLRRSRVVVDYQSQDRSRSTGTRRRAFARGKLSSSMLASVLLDHTISVCSRADLTWFCSAAEQIVMCLLFPTRITHEGL